MLITLTVEGGREGEGEEGRERGRKGRGGGGRERTLRLKMSLLDSFLTLKYWQTHYEMSWEWYMSLI